MSLLRLIRQNVQKKNMDTLSMRAKQLTNKETAETQTYKYTKKQTENKDKGGHKTQHTFVNMSRQLQF